MPVWGLPSSQKDKASTKVSFKVPWNKVTSYKCPCCYCCLPFLLKSSCRLPWSISQPHHCLHSCLGKGMSRARQGGEPTKGKGLWHRQRRDGFVMWGPLIPPCIAHPLKLEYGTPGIHVEAEGKKLPDSCPGTQEQQRRWAEAGGKGCMKRRPVLRLWTGMQHLNIRKTKSCKVSF